MESGVPTTASSNPRTIDQGILDILAVGHRHGDRLKELRAHGNRRDHAEECAHQWRQRWERGTTRGGSSWDRIRPRNWDAGSPMEFRRIRGTGVARFSRNAGPMHQKVANRGTVDRAPRSRTMDAPDQSGQGLPMGPFSRTRCRPWQTRVHGRFRCWCGHSSASSRQPWGGSRSGIPGSRMGIGDPGKPGILPLRSSTCSADGFKPSKPPHFTFPCRDGSS